MVRIWNVRLMHLPRLIQYAAKNPVHVTLQKNAQEKADHVLQINLIKIVHVPQMARSKAMKSILQFVPSRIIINLF